MKRKYNLYFTLISLFIIITIILISFLNVNVNAISDKDVLYTFEKDTLFNQNNDTFYYDVNTREYEVFNNTGHYNATFSFENDVDGSNPANFTTIESGGNIIKVIGESHNHKKVVEFHRVDTNINIQYNYTKGAQNEGTVEWWGKASQLDIRGWVMFYPEVGNYLFFLGFRNDGTICYYDGEYVSYGAYVIDKWYHFKVEYNSNAQLFSVWINDILMTGGDEPYINTDGDDDINNIKFIVSDGDGDIYIDAIGIYKSIYTGEHFDVGNQDAYSYGITSNTTNFLVSGSQYDKIYKYYLNGTYTGVSFDSPDISPTGITLNGNYIWLVGANNKRVYKIASNGIYTGESFYVGGQDTAPKGITSDGTYIWVVGNNHRIVCKYYLNGTYTNESFYVGWQDFEPAGIIWDGNYFWITATYYDTVYKYNLNGIYTGESFYVGEQDTSPLGITFVNNQFWILGRDNQEVYSYIFSKQDYQIGDNFYPNEEFIESGMEVDKWEFSYKNLLERFEDGDDNPSGWTDLEDGEDDVNCKYNDYQNGLVEFYAGSGDTIGLYKDTFQYTMDILLDLSFDFEIKYIYSILNNDLYIKVYSSDNTEIVRIRINNDGTLKYWNGANYVEIDTGFTINVDYSIRLSINYDNDTCLLTYYTNNIYTDDFTFDLITSDKTGLKKVSFEVCADTNYVQVYLDSIGIYVNNRSITTDFASVGLHVSDHCNWYFNEHNLLKFNVIGNNIALYLYVAEYTYTLPPGRKNEEIIGLNNYYGQSKIINLYNFVYDDYWQDSFIYGGVLWFHFYDTFEFIEVSIEGVKLNDGTNQYDLEYESSGVDVQNNYFYVENNKLYFTQISDDNDLEFIEATFNIENMLTINYSVRYISVLNGNSEGHFRISYTDDTSTLFPLKTYISAPDVVLPQDKEINELVILITDNDDDSIQGTTTGYITSIKLIYLPDVSITIITTALFSILIPLLILIIPTFLIYMRLGKTAIVPTFLLMSFICFITNLIPLWVFFIILISSGVFILSKKVFYKEGE